eukprot:172905-Chlamydomonas_euryale.AAC.6
MCELCEPGWNACYQQYMHKRAARQNVFPRYRKPLSEMDLREPGERTPPPQPPTALTPPQVLL